MALGGPKDDKDMEAFMSAVPGDGRGGKPHIADWQLATSFAIY